MKTILLALALSVCAFGQAQPPDSSSPNSSSSNSSPIPLAQQNAQQAKAVLNQAIQALGGSAYLNVKDISQEGRSYSFYHGQPNSEGVQFWRFIKYPDKDRIELTKQRDVIEIYDGMKGYEVTYKGIRNQEDKDLKDYLRRRHYSLPEVLRTWINQPGVALFYENQTVAESKQVDQVTVMNAQNEGVTLFIDTSTHLPVKKTFTWRDPTDKERNTEDEIYDGYRNTQGVMTPFTITRYFNGDMAGQSFLTSVVYNQNLPDYLFDPHMPSPAHKK